MPSCCAISLLLFPSAAKRSTSTSRGVSDAVAPVTRASRTSARTRAQPRSTFPPLRLSARALRQITRNARSTRRAEQSGSSLIEPAVPASAIDRFHPPAHIDLLENVLHVILHRVKRQRESHRDVAIAQ